MRWILVANQIKARIFEQSWANQPLKSVTQLDHPEGRLRNHELKEGLPGRSFDSGSQSHQRHAMGTEVSPHEHETQHFAKKVIDVLEMGRQKHQYDELILVAEPGFLGHLTHEMKPDLQRLVKDKIKKDLVHLSDQELARHLHTESSFQELS